MNFVLLKIPTPKQNSINFFFLNIFVKRKHFPKCLTPNQRKFLTPDVL